MAARFANGFPTYGQEWHDDVVVNELPVFQVAASPGYITEGHRSLESVGLPSGDSKRHILKHWNWTASGGWRLRPHPAHAKVLAIGSWLKSPIEVWQLVRWKLVLD